MESAVGRNRRPVGDPSIDRGRFAQKLPFGRRRVGANGLASRAPASVEFRIRRQNGELQLTGIEQTFVAGTIVVGPAPKGGIRQ